MATAKRADYSGGTHFVILFYSGEPILYASLFPFGHLISLYVATAPLPLSVSIFAHSMKIHVRGKCSVCFQRGRVFHFCLRLCSLGELPGYIIRAKDKEETNYNVSKTNHSQKVHADNNRDT